MNESVTLISPCFLGACNNVTDQKKSPFLLNAGFFGPQQKEGSVSWEIPRRFSHQREAFHEGALAYRTQTATDGGKTG